MKTKKHYSPEQKIFILKDLLENNIPISQVAEKYVVTINLPPLGSTEYVIC